MQRWTVGYDFDSPLVEPVEGWEVEVGEQCVGCDSCPGFPADSCCSSFQRASSSSQDPGPGACCTVVAKGVKDATAVRGKGRRRRRSRRRNKWERKTKSSEYGMVVKTLLACGPDWDASMAWLAEGLMRRAIHLSWLCVWRLRPVVAVLW